MLEGIIYVWAFVIGTLLGSFATLAVYRIPRGENIIYKHSYCPNCHHLLAFGDLIPIFSYLFLKGKCPYCHQKIRIRYLLLEIFSGLLYAFFIASLPINFATFDVQQAAYIGIMTAFLVCMILMIGILKEKNEIPGSLMKFCLIFSVLYIVYLYIVGVNIYRYVIYAILLLVLTICLKGKKQLCSICFILLFSFLFTGTSVMLMTLFVTIVWILFHTIQKRKWTMDGIGFALGSINLVILTLSNFMRNGM